MQNNNSIYSDLFKVIHLKEDAQELSGSLDGILAGMYRIGNLSFIERATNVFSKDVVEAFTMCLEKNNIDANDPPTFVKFAQGLQAAIREAKIADITVGASLDLGSIKQISLYLREAFADDTLLISLRVDPKILGGIELIWKGRYFNYTLEKQVADWFAVHRKYENL